MEMGQKQDLKQRLWDCITAELRGLARTVAACKKHPFVIEAQRVLQTTPTRRVIGNVVVTIALVLLAVFALALIPTLWKFTQCLGSKFYDAIDAMKLSALVVALAAVSIASSGFHVKTFKFRRHSPIRKAKLRWNLLAGKANIVFRRTTVRWGKTYTNFLKILPTFQDNLGQLLGFIGELNSDPIKNQTPSNPQLRFGRQRPTV